MGCGCQSGKCLLSKACRSELWEAVTGPLMNPFQWLSLLSTSATLIPEASDCIRGDLLSYGSPGIPSAVSDRRCFSYYYVLWIIGSVYHSQII